MPRRSQRDKNLEEAKQKRRAAQKKVSRLEHNGVRVRKAEIAPIVPLSELEGMSARQLRTHIKELERFNSRETSFVAGFRGEPLRRQDVNELLRLQAQHGKIADSIESRLAGMPDLPGSNQTPLERAQMLSRSNKTGGIGTMFQHVTQFVPGIKDQQSLEKMIADWKEKSKPNFLEKVVDRRMNSIEALLKNSGYSDVLKDVRKLTPEQINILLDYTTFTGIAKERFGSGEDGRRNVERMDRDYELRNGVDRADSVREDLNTVIQYVKDNTRALSSTSPTKSQSGRQIIGGSSRSGKRIIRGTASSRRRKN